MMKEHIEKLQDLINNLVSNNTELNLRDLKEIKIVNDLGNKSSDGRFEIDTILLPKDNIKNKENNIIELTIYHEFCHVDLIDNYNILIELERYVSKYINND